ncbi:unnamed protein product [Notodromas monacha]|uniref:Uncharacterized protein n=1 Tax=Notodromas monacha TaxID=399045 RepID=A0A7R9GI56_9CRUS|nr:unnamed protein product [Notodromas monacha]CAG0922232.1 unnamed protein product [Notodromas monacha]
MPSIWHTVWSRLDAMMDEQLLDAAINSGRQTVWRFNPAFEPRMGVCADLCKDCTCPVDESVPGGPDARNSSETVAKGTHHLSPLQGRLLTAEDKEAAFVVTVTANYTTSEPKIVYAGCLLSERTVLTFYNSLIAPPNDPYIKIDGAVVTAGVQASAAPEDKQVRFVPSSNITAFPGRKPSSYDINTSLKNAMTLLQVAEPFILGTATQFIRVATDRGPSLAAISASDLMVFGFPRIVPGSPAKFDGTVLGMECPLTSPGFFYGADLDTNATSCVVISPRTGSTCNPVRETL